MAGLGHDDSSRWKIPCVKDLCQDLGFDTEVSQHHFRESVANWRKAYKTASGKSGTALLDWDSCDDMCNLGVMAKNFVEAGSNAHDFWPSDGGASSQVKPRYPKDEIKILQLLRRLMWRQNRNLAVNSRRGRRGNNSINSDESDSEEEYSPISPIQRSQPSSHSSRQFRSRPPVDTSIAKDRLSNNAATGLQAKPVSGMGGLPGSHQNRTSSHAPHRFGLPPQFPASPGSSSNLSPGSAYCAPAIGSSNMSPKRGNSEGDIQGQSEASKRSRKPIPPDVHHMSPQMPADAASDFDPRSTSSALATTTSDVSPIIDSSSNMENTQAPSLQQERSHQTPLGSNDAGNEFNHEDRNSTLSQLHSPTSQTFASDSEPLRNLNTQPDDLRETAQLGNSNSPPSQANPSATTVRPEVGVFIVECSGPRITIKEWSGPSLRDRTLKSIFDEITTTFPGQPLQRIKFQLETLKKENDMECLIERDGDKIFEVMLQKFRKRVNERKSAGETKFKLYLEPDRGVQAATVSEALEDEEDYF